MSAPDIIADLKADLGITTDTDDAWLQRRIDAVWARMEVYTQRKLCAPPVQFVDDWGNIVANNPVYAMPPVLAAVPRASVFLRYFPVVSIDEIVLDGQALANTPRFDKDSGKLLGLHDAEPADVSSALRQSRARITYTAGWGEVPADLYEVVLGAIQPLWSARKVGATAGFGGTVTGVNVVDVGSIELSDANSFVSAAAKAGGGGGDPLLGPYTAMLDPYIDHRSLIGWAGQPTTEPAP